MSLQGQTQRAKQLGLKDQEFLQNKWGGVPLKDKKGNIAQLSSADQECEHNLTMKMVRIFA